jgi:hypothetical protein
MKKNFKMDEDAHRILSEIKKELRDKGIDAVLSDAVRELHRRQAK